MNSSKYYDCPEAATTRRGCCLGTGWEIFTRPVCDGVEMYCAPAESGDPEATPACMNAEKFGTPEALERY